MAVDECSHVGFGTENRWTSGSAPACRHWVRIKADQAGKKVVTYWADVFQLGMHSRRIRQQGARGSEKESEIGMRVVVHACVGRCQRLNEFGYRIGSVGGDGTKMSRHEGTTRLPRPFWIPVTTCAGNQRTNIRQQQLYRRSHYLLRQPFRLKNSLQISTIFFLLPPTPFHKT